MANDYYGTQDAGTGTSATDSEPNPSPDTNSEEGAETFLVPLDALGEDVKPGKQCTIEVVQVFEDEAECKYLDSENEPDHKSAMDQSMGSMDEMATEKG